MQSGTSKQVTDLSLEELLSHVENTQEKPEEKLLLDDVSAFFSTYNVKPGKYKVKKQFLYEFYKQWSKDPTGPTQFGAKARQFFEYNNSYYFLDKKAFDIVSKIIELTKDKKNSFIKSAKYKNHVEFFFASNGIKRGTFYFPVSIMAILYRNWCRKNHYKVGLKGWRFEAMCKTYFQHKTVKNELLLRVDTNIFQYLSKEQLQKVNDGTYGEEKNET
jgi:hypothetical protein